MCLESKNKYPHEPAPLVQDKNAALRDPVLARCSCVQHPITKNKYNVYPMYDLSCPIVDSIENITHAFRDSQYNDRKYLYTWVQEKLNLRLVDLKEFSRLNFEYTLLSKRKLEQLINMSIIDNWNNPVLPTIRCIYSRGLTIKALKLFIQSQGTSIKMTNMSMNKLWAINKKIIDPIIPRYSALKESFTLHIDNYYQHFNSNKKEITKKGFKRFIDLGNNIIIDKDDVKDIKHGDEITLMDFGNVKCHTINENCIISSFVPNGDYKNTKKLNWLVDTSNNIKIRIDSYNNLLTIKKLDKNKDWMGYVNKSFKRKHLESANQT